MIGSTTVNCTCQVTDLVLYWDEPSGMFDVECYVVTVSPYTHNMTSPDICKFTPTESSDTGILTTKSTSLLFPISVGVNYSVLVRTVTRCGQLSSPTMLQEDVGFVRIGKQ